MTDKEKLLEYINSEKFNKFIVMDLEDNFHREFKFLKEDNKYYCDITKAEESEVGSGRWHTVGNTVRYNINDVPETTCTILIQSIQDYLNKKYTEIIKEISQKEIGCAPDILTQEVLKELGFEQDDIEPSWMKLKWIDLNFYINIEQKHMMCSRNDIKNTEIFSYVSEQPFYVHELVLALKLCKIRVEN